ncbi:anti-sigma F factor antagonist [Paenibacillus thermoaerophilus]|uniref:Anti-sigma F factor antagonist n=1 Tax=Paenibacillus thermoaerophilus TaxID=1215385 RepID=A0ABW2V3M9_9BACL|nr:anti-sigma F factor antagonist [Paenibacillus thermoaerophilus]TMV12019.1 anti-sigma F factor antagonist [Paenibacillus thermoaerophilus]
MSLQIELEHHRRTLIARLRGELDHHTADKVKTMLEDAILRGDVHHVVLSMKGLTFMDSSGLGVVLGRYKQIANKGGKLVVCEVHPSIYRLFEMSGLFKILTVEPSEQDALSRLEVVS